MVRLEFYILVRQKIITKRLANYVNNFKALSNRIKMMIALTKYVKIEITKTEEEALLLEATLIKKYRPRYNILLKDDKSYPFIAINQNHNFPEIYKYRGKQKADIAYFGPFISAKAVDDTLNIIKKTFLIRSCSDNEFKNRKKPCLEYQIKRCSAPCVKYISKEDYAKNINQAFDFLKGKNSYFTRKAGITNGKCCK